MGGNQRPSNLASNRRAPGQGRNAVRGDGVGTDCVRCRCSAHLLPAVEGLLHQHRRDQPGIRLAAIPAGGLNKPSTVRSEMPPAEVAFRDQSNA